METSFQKYVRNRVLTRAQGLFPLLQAHNDWYDAWLEARNADFKAEYPVMYVDPAAKPEWCEGFHPIVHVEPAPPPVPAPPSHEHIWNMLVLAAESSRYEEKP